MFFRRVAALVSFFLACALALAQISPINLEPLNKDVNTLFSSLGKDLSPSINALARSGDALVGAAELPGKTGIYVSFLGIGATSMDGVGKVLGTSDTDTWKFQLVPIPSLVTGALKTAAANDIFSMVTTRAFGLPSFRMGFGFRLPAGFEILANGFYLPNALVAWGVGLLPATISGKISGVGTSIEMLTVGGTVRKVLLSEKQNKKLPALSMGLGYTYSQFDLGADAFSLAGLGITAPEVAGLGTLGLSGKIGFTAKVHTAGASLAVSKTLLYFFRPFLKTSVNFYHSEYDSVFDVTATVNPSAAALEAAALAGTTVPTITQALSAPVAILRDDLSLFASSGFELAFPGFIITIAATADMEQPALSFDELTLNGIGLMLAMRLQF